MVAINKFIIGLFILVFLSTSVNGLVTKEVFVNVTDTEDLKLLYISLDNPQDIGGNTAKFDKFLNKVYPLSDLGLVSDISSYSYSTDTLLSGLSKPYGEIDLSGLLTGVYVKTLLAHETFDNILLITPFDWFELNTKYPMSTGYSFLAFPEISLVEETGMKHDAAHEIGHTYGLCDEDDETVWKKYEKRS